MGSTISQLSSPNQYQDAQEQYRRDLDKWEHTVSAIQAEEDLAQLNQAPSCCCLSVYTLQNMAAYCCETPTRVCHHGCCCCLFSPLLLCREADAEPPMQWAHHSHMISMYGDLCIGLLYLNIVSACTCHCQEIHYLYRADVHIARPAKPTPPPVPADVFSLLDECCKFDCCDCTPGCCSGYAERIQSISNRHLRSLYCCFSCHKSCHCHTCCGPECPMCPWGEALSERHERWLDEYDQDLNARTQKFNTQYDQANYNFTRNDSGVLVATRRGDYAVSLQQPALADITAPQEAENVPDTVMAQPVKPARGTPMAAQSPPAYELPSHKADTDKAEVQRSESVTSAGFQDCEQEWPEDAPPAISARSAI